MVTETKINLLYVITKLELGGAQTHLLSLIRGIDRRKFNVFLFTARDGFLVDEALAIAGLSVFRSPFLERRIDPFRDLFTFISLYFFIKKNKIGLVHTHSSKAGVLGRLAAGAAGVRRIIHTVHGWSFHEHQSGWIYRSFLFLEKFCAGFTHRLIVVSARDEQRGRENGIVPLEGYCVIRCGINREDFKREDQRGRARREFGFGELDLVVGMVACFKPQKAPLDFIRLAAELKTALPGVKFVLAGDGILRGAITALVREAGLEKDIVLTGWRRDVGSVLSALDVFVLTSLWEGLPVAVLESMAAGVAVVATDTGGIRDVIVQGDTGYLVPTGDIRGMRDRVLELLGNPELRMTVSRRAAEFIAGSEFTSGHAVRKIEALYSNMRAVNV